MSEDSLFIIYFVAFKDFEGASHPDDSPFPVDLVQHCYVQSQTREDAKKYFSERKPHCLYVGIRHLGELL